MRLKAILLDVAHQHDFQIPEMEVMPDHIHVFARSNPGTSPRQIYKALKGVSGRRLFIEFPRLRRYLWSGSLWNHSTFIETIGYISEETVRRYIREQKTK